MNRDEISVHIVQAFAGATPTCQYCGTVANKVVGAIPNSNKGLPVCDQHVEQAKDELAEQQAEQELEKMNQESARWMRNHPRPE